MTVTPIYAGLISLLFVALSFRVIGFRRQVKVALGDGGSTTLTRRLRAHGNFAEYVPIGLLLLVMLEMSGAPVWMVHILALMLLAGRLMHGWALSFTDKSVTGRVGGMGLTLFSIGLSALATLAYALIPVAGAIEIAGYVVVGALYVTMIVFSGG